MSPAVRGFESGTTSPDAFAEALVAEFGLPLTPETFLREFSLWPRAVFSGVSELLTSLRGRFILASFSNTNSIHWSRVREEFDLLDHFDLHFPSHVIGKMKPDREAFEYILEATGVPAERILFFDDNPMNVAGAQSVGITAHRVDGPRDVARVLCEYKISTQDYVGFEG